MRNGMITACVLVTGLLLVTVPSSLRAQAGGVAFDSRVGPSFSFSISALLMGRSGPDGVDRVFRESDFEPVFNTSAIDFSPEPGVEMKMTFHGEYTGKDIEFIYTGVDTFHEAPVVFADEPLLPLLFGGVPSAPENSYQLDYLSQFHSGEINHRWRMPRGALLAGFRFIELREEFSAVDSDGVLETGTDNDLYGYQVGADFYLWDHVTWSVYTALRTGAYYNNADVSGDFVDPATGADLDLRDDEDVVAFVGELQLAGRLAMGPAANLLFGYRAIWLDGVGLAPDQVDNFDVFTGVGSLNKSTVIFHGGHLGVELFW